MTTTHHVPGLPFALASSPGAEWRVDEAAGAVAVTASPRSDLFIDPGADDGAGTGAEGTQGTSPAATLLGIPPEGDFRFGARVTVGFGAVFDAGVLLLRIDDRHWGKLCFEYSPDREPMVVSVVARGVADDANAFTVDGRTVWLRVSRIGRAFAYHASPDGSLWRLVRYFALHDPAAPVSLGFEAQSPTGDGCEVRFDDVRFTRERLHELRDGS